MNYVLFDDPEIRAALLPFTFTRPVAKIRMGIFTIDQKWEQYLKSKVSFATQPYLQDKFPQESASEKNIFINGAVCPTTEIVAAISNLTSGQSLIQNGTLLAYCDNQVQQPIQYSGGLTIVRQCWDIFTFNSKEISADFEMIRAARKSQPVDDAYTRVYHPENIFIEEGVTIRAAVLNAENGPIYLGRNSVVQEGALIKGPFALCEGANINMGAKMRGDSTIGPYSKVGGEISNSVIFGYSNKAHDGFIGNTVIGEWCNLGADTNTSNLKNNYGEVEVYSYKENKYIKTGKQFCGLFMGDHSKCGINTMFNTGTVVGVNANIFGGGFPPKFVPSFSWGGPQGFEDFELNKSFEVAGRVMGRRNIAFDRTEVKIFEELFRTKEGVKF